MTTRKTKTDKPKFYDLKAILSKNADYNVIFGERSNGKTYAALRYGLETISRRANKWRIYAVGVRI